MEGHFDRVERKLDDIQCSCSNRIEREDLEQLLSRLRIQRDTLANELNAMRSLLSAMERDFDRVERQLDGIQSRCRRLRLTSNHIRSRQNNLSFGSNDLLIPVMTEIKPWSDIDKLLSVL